jgi:hypothetical protein
MTVAKLYSSIASAGRIGEEKHERIGEMPTPSGVWQENAAMSGYEIARHKNWEIDIFRGQAADALIAMTKPDDAGFSKT